MFELSIQDIQAKMTTGELTSRRLVEYYLDRIQSIDQSGPRLNAIIEINPDALIIADQMDMERLNGTVRGPLHGIPIVLKDNIDTYDHMTTTAGSLALEGMIAQQDAFLVRQLRQANSLAIQFTAGGHVARIGRFSGKAEVSGGLVIDTKEPSRPDGSCDDAALREAIRDWLENGAVEGG